MLPACVANGSSREPERSFFVRSLCKTAPLNKKLVGNRSIDVIIDWTGSFFSMSDLLMNLIEIAFVSVHV